MHDGCGRLSSSTLSQSFLARRPEFARSLERPRLDELLRDALERAQAAWPSVALSEHQFTEYLADRVPANADIVRWFATLQAADLYLCCACTGGNPAALRAFEEKVLPQVVAAIASIDREPSFIAEVEQQVRRKLLLPEDSTPRISEYAGLGPLVHWLRAVAVRTALNLRRAQNRQDVPVGDEALLNLPHSRGDLELDYLKRRYQKEFTQAFRAALATLTSEERNVLRLHFVEGLTLSQIGAVYQADKSTISRWITKARQGLLERTRNELTEKLRLDSRELDSLMHLVQSQLDVSLSSLLRRTRA